MHLLNSFLSRFPFFLPKLLHGQNDSSARYYFISIRNREIEQCSQLAIYSYAIRVRYIEMAPEKIEISLNFQFSPPPIDRDVFSSEKDPDAFWEIWVLYIVRGMERGGY